MNLEKGGRNDAKNSDMAVGMYDNAHKLPKQENRIINPGGNRKMRNKKKYDRPLSDEVDIRVNADTSYQIKRIMEVVANEKGLEMISNSGIKKNNRRRKEEEKFLRGHATFRDLKFEKRYCKGKAAETKQVASGK